MTRETELCGTKRCVIYCRKSTSNGLDRDYTSIDCQTDTCKGFIERHEKEGWRFTGQVYADGGYSGGNTDRPQFQRMMDAVRAGEIDVIVIYKLDRISRNKRDFWNLVHELNEYNVTISTATQLLELQTSSGRATTGIMMDFAELEREIDSERIRGQICAARVAGRWACGKYPYGYNKGEHSSLLLNEEKAKRVRYIFTRYPIVKSAKQVAIELNEKFGEKEPGKPWSTTHIYKILENIVYKGFVSYNDKTYKGVHAAIVSEEEWNKARAVAMENTVDKTGRRRVETYAEFKDIIRCSHCGCAMVPKFAKHKNRRYIYYKCSKDEKRAISTCPIKSISSTELDRPVWNEIERILRSGAFYEALETVCPELKKHDKNALENLSTFIEQLYPIERTRIVHALIKEIRISTSGLDIVFRGIGALGIAEEMRHDHD